MARCDEGYLCDVCGQDVAEIVDSDLYLRYVLGEVSPLELPRQRERHIRCNAATAEYIVAAEFEPLGCDSFFAKESMDAEFVRWQKGGDAGLASAPGTADGSACRSRRYPLPEVRRVGPTVGNDQASETIGNAASRQPESTIRVPPRWSSVLIPEADSMYEWRRRIAPSPPIRRGRIR